MISQTYGVRAYRQGDPRPLTYLTGEPDIEFAKALANRLWEGIDIASVELISETTTVMARKAR